MEYDALVEEGIQLLEIQGELCPEDNARIEDRLEEIRALLRHLDATAIDG